MIFNKSYLRNGLNIALVFIIVFALAYLMGTSVLYLIDHKMNDISINMPKINLPKPNVNVYLPGLSSTTSNGQIWAEYAQPNNIEQNGGDLYNGKTEKDITQFTPKTPIKVLNSSSEIPPKSNEQENNNKDTSNQKTQKVSFPLSRKTNKGVYDDVKSLLQKLNLYNKISQRGGNLESEIDQNKPLKCRSDQDCNRVPGQTGNVCKYDSTCYCLTGKGPFCSDGLTYYKNPQNMTPKQLYKFKNQAQFSKMTLQDYINWLGLFRNDISELSEKFPLHVDNFQKLISGETVTIEDFNKVKENLKIKTYTDYKNWIPWNSEAEEVDSQGQLSTPYGKGERAEIWAPYPMQV